MAPATKSSADSLFTVDSLVSKCKDVLKAVEKREEGWEWWEFICLFRDRSGIVAGGFQKKDKKIRGMVIFGQGPSWSKVVTAATSLAMNDEMAADKVISKLGAFKASGAPEQSIEKNNVRFQIVRFTDGQLLFKIKPIPSPQSSEKTVKSGPILVAAGTARFSSSGTLIREYPTLGITLNTFKKRFDNWLSTAASKALLEESQQQFKRDALMFSFGKVTCLMVFAADKKNVSQLLIKGLTDEAAEFWICLEATIVSLNPKISDAERREILKELGKTKTNALPKGKSEFDDGKMRYTYQRVGTSCVLQIWPAY